MSHKRKADSIDKAGTKALDMEAKLLDLQNFTYDLLVNTRDGKGGITKSTRAYADPLLNLEVKILRDKCTELTALVKNLEKKNGESKSSTSDSITLEALRRENEELRQHLGEVGQQMSMVRAEMQDAHITELTNALKETHKTINTLRKEKEAQDGEIFTLKARIKDLLANGGKAIAGATAATGAGSDSDSEAGDFSSFFAAARAHGGAADSD